jgi:hypothetical protein
MSAQLSEVELREQDAIELRSMRFLEVMFGIETYSVVFEDVAAPTLAPLERLVVHALVWAEPKLAEQLWRADQYAELVVWALAEHQVVNGRREHPSLSEMARRSQWITRNGNLISPAGVSDALGDAMEKLGVRDRDELVEQIIKGLRWMRLYQLTPRPRSKRTGKISDPNALGRLHAVKPW